MSMINDALKKAKSTQPSGATAAGPALRPVEQARQPRGIDWLMSSLIVVILLLAGLLIFAWYSSTGQVTTVRARTIDTLVNKEIATPPVVTAQLAPATAVTNPIVLASTNPPTLAPAKPIAKIETAAPIAPPKPAPVTYKLQGIIYRGHHSSAMINGKTVFVGEHVGDARVVAINGEAVIIVTASGQTNLLELP